MTLNEKQMALAAELGCIRNGQERLACLVERGRRQPSFDDHWKRDEFLVQGCLSKLWFVPEFRAGRCFFRADSDSAIVKGVARLLCELYSGSLPAEILAHDHAFLAMTGITRHLTPNRRDGLGRLTGMIHAFAREHQPAEGSAMNL